MFGRSNAHVKVVTEQDTLTTHTHAHSDRQTGRQDKTGRKHSNTRLTDSRLTDAAHFFSTYRVLTLSFPPPLFPSAKCHFIAGVSSPSFVDDCFTTSLGNPSPAGRAGRRRTHR